MCVWVLWETKKKISKIDYRTLSRFLLFRLIKLYIIPCTFRNVDPSLLAWPVILPLIIKHFIMTMYQQEMPGSKRDVGTWGETRIDLLGEQHSIKYSLYNQPFKNPAQRTFHGICIKRASYLINIPGLYCH